MTKELNFTEAACELRTIRDLLRFGMTQFNEHELYYGHGTDNSWDEALELVLFALSLSHHIDPNLQASRLTKSERERILALFKRRIIERIPAPYLTNRAYFSEIEFYVDQRVLIPRSPVAELLENQFEPWIDPNKVENILDLCCGGGCIAIACAMAFPDSHVDGADLSTSALDVARINQDKYHLQDRMQFIESNLFNNLDDTKYDIIVSNPPYVSAEELKTVPEEYRHEPENALYADDDGLDIVIRILQESSQHLSDAGILIVEVGNSQETLEHRFPHVPFIWLEFTRGGHGVFLLTAEQVKQFFG